MQVTKWVCLAAVWTLVMGEDADNNPNPETQNYQFRYYVRDESTGDIKSQEETKQGSVVSGHYSVGEPTGDLRVVTYTADEGGFRANVKYEEGGSPGSEDKAKQTSAKSGVMFQWLPALDNIQEGKTGPESDGNEDSGQNKEDTSGNVSLEDNQSEVENTTPNENSQPSEPSSESTTENPSSTEASNESLTSGSSESESVIVGTTDEKIPKEESEDIGSSLGVSNESDPEQSFKVISEVPPTSLQTSPESTPASTESSVENTFESSTMTSSEAKSTMQTEIDNNPPTDNEQSAEAAESAPLSEEVLPPPSPPNNMYLPVISYQNLPFLNLPTLGNAQEDNEKPPTIIYASQNFYNPWQWFGGNRRVAREIRYAHGYKPKSLNHGEYLGVQKPK